MNPIIFKLLSASLLLAASAAILAETTIYKCKAANGETTYKKAPCAADTDTLTSWTPKPVKIPESKGPTETIEPVTLTLKQTPAGHYTVSGRVDQAQVTFIVDTGASYLSLPESLANAAQIYCNKTVAMTTANGNSDACTAKAKEVVFGPFTLTNVDLILGRNLAQPLLGMNVLKRFSIVQEEGVMKLSVKPNPTQK